MADSDITYIVRIDGGNITKITEMRGLLLSEATVLGGHLDMTRAIQRLASTPVAGHDQGEDHGTSERPAPRRPGPGETGPA